MQWIGVITIKSTLYKLSAIPVILGLQACTPHPGAGHWQAIENSDSKFSKIMVEFEGRAELFSADAAVEAQRCFWAGNTSSSIKLQCTQGDDTGLEFIYVLKVDARGTEPIASLTSGDQRIGSYRRQPR